MIKMHITYAIVARLILGFLLIDSSTVNGKGIVLDSAPVGVFFSRPYTTDSQIRDALIDLIDSAQISLDANFYQVNEPFVVDAFCRAAKRLEKGKVRFVTEDDYRYHNKYKDGYIKMEEAGVILIDDKADGSAGSGLTHNKFMIADGKILWTGSFNLTVNSWSRNAENAVLVQEPKVVAVYQKEFDQMHEKKLFKRKKADVSQDLGDIGIYFAPVGPVRYQFLKAINEAQKEINFLVFTFTDQEIADALIRKAKSGIIVRGVFDSLSSHSQYSAIHPMREQGLDVLVDPNKGLLHSKVFIVDPGTTKEIVITGSYNPTKGADTINDENTIIFKNYSQLTREYMADFNKWYFNAKEGIQVSPDSLDDLDEFDSRVQFAVNQADYYGGVNSLVNFICSLHDQAVLELDLSQYISSINMQRRDQLVSVAALSLVGIADTIQGALFALDQMIMPTEPHQDSTVYTGIVQTLNAFRMCQIKTE